MILKRIDIKTFQSIKQNDFDILRVHLLCKVDDLGRVSFKRDNYNIEYNGKNYEKAIELYDQSLDKGLNDISAVYFNKGLVYERMSNVDLAVEFYKKAVELKPQYYDYFEKRARLQRSGEWTN